MVARDWIWSYRTEKGPKWFCGGPVLRALLDHNFSLKGKYEYEYESIQCTCF